MDNATLATTVAEWFECYTNLCRPIFSKDLEDDPRLEAVREGHIAAQAWIVKNKISLRRLSEQLIGAAEERKVDSTPLGLLIGSMDCEPVAEIWDNVHAFVQRLEAIANMPVAEPAVAVKQPVDTTPAPPGGWSKADTPKRWAAIFQISERTFKRRCKDGKIRHKKLSDRRYMVANDDLPTTSTLP